MTERPAHRPGSRRPSGTQTVRQWVRIWIADLLGRSRGGYREREDRPRRIRAQIFALLGIAASLVYLGWAATVLNTRMRWLSIPFLLGEALGLVNFALFTMTTWHPRFHRPEGVGAKRVYSVDILVTTCGEPYAVVAETLRAAVAMAYPAKRVYLLDDAASADLRRLAEALECGYLARPVRHDAKAGNLNYALSRTEGDLILTVDADQVPDKALAATLVGYFDAPQMGFVATKQAFELPPGDPFCNADVLFYDVMQPGKDRHNAAFSCGSGVMYRRKALEDIGGFSTWNLVEDVHTSMLLHAAGWRSVYYEHALSRGTAPADIWGVYHQRAQWATDGLRILFWDNPFLRRGLSWAQRAEYTHVGLVYLFAGWVMPLFYLVPVVSLLSAQCVIVTDLWHYLLFRGPGFLLTSYATHYIHAAAPRGVSFLRATGTWLGYAPAFQVATFVALFSPRQKPAYAVTEKVARVNSVTRRLLGTAPHWLVIAGVLIAIPLGWTNPRADWNSVLINTLWAVNQVMILIWLVRAPWVVRRASDGVEDRPAADQR